MKIRSKLDIYKGFTLVELIIVIVILGVIAVIATPKFIDISSDARKAQLRAHSANIKATANLVFASCQLTPGCPNIVNGNSIVPNGFDQPVRMLNGYPDAGTMARTDEINDIMDNGDFIVSAVSHTTVRWSFENTSNCHVQYTQNFSSSTVPLIEIDDSGC